MVIYNGESLKIHVEERLAGISKERFIARRLHDYVDSPNDRKVYFLYGPVGTGKTTMMLQEIERIGDYDKCLFLHCCEGNSVRQIHEMIETYPDCRYVFIDETTKAQNFTSNSSVLADNYAAEGKKIIIAGEDLSIVRNVRQDELFDRAHFVDTTYIPFGEYNELLEMGIMDYMKCDGVLIHEEGQEDVRSVKDYAQHLKEIVLCQAVHTAKKIGRSIIASKYESRTGDGGFDVFFVDLKNRKSCIVEVWLADKPDEEQIKRLTDIILCRKFDKFTGAVIQNKIVLYTGDSVFNPSQADEPEEKVLYINVETFLKSPEQSMRALLRGPVEEEV